MAFAILISASIFVAYLFLLAVFKLFDHVIRQAICEEPNEWYAEETRQAEALRLEIEELDSRE